MERIYPRFVRTLEEACALPPRSKVRLAISGGPDSTALLLLFVRYRERRRPDLVLSAGHVHHGARGEEADGDEAFCRELAARHALPFGSARIDAPRLARERGISFESAARGERLHTFQRWAEANALDSVATGHTAGDQVETVLGNLLRGSGVRGLGGMEVVRPLCEGRRVLLIKPLLHVERPEVERFLAQEGIEPRRDSTNAERTFRRNRIRHDLLPLLERDYNPAVRRALLGLASEARALEAYCERRIAPLLAAVEYGPALACLELRRLAELEAEPALLAPILDAMWAEAAVARAGTSSNGLTRSHHEAWCALASGATSGASCCLPAGWRLERAGGWIYLLRAGSSAPPLGSRLEPIGATPLPWLGAELRMETDPGAPHAAGAVQLPAVQLPAVRLPAAWLRAGASVRPARRGDRIATEVGHQDVMELMRGRGIPQTVRESYPLLDSAGEPRWIPGLRSAWAGDAGGATLCASLSVDATHSPAAFLLARFLRGDRVP